MCWCVISATPGGLWNIMGIIFSEMIVHKSDTKIVMPKNSAAGAIKKKHRRREKFFESVRDRRAVARAAQKHYSLPWCVQVRSENRGSENQGKFWSLMEYQGN